MPSKSLDITPGYYYDGKKGLRRVLSVERGRVVYERFHPIGMAVPSHEIPLSEFVRWASRAISQSAAEDLHMTLQAKAVKPSPAQMEGLLAASKGEVVRGKVLTSLIEKHLVLCPALCGVSPELTQLGRRVLAIKSDK